MKLLLVAALLMGAALPASADEACGSGQTSELLKLADWTIKPVSDDTNHMTETLTYVGSKPLRMVDGSIRFGDALGGSIASMSIDRDISIAPGANYVQEGDWGPYTFERILKMNRADVTAVACVRAVVYSDGTKETF